MKQRVHADTDTVAHRCGDYGRVLAACLVCYDTGCYLVIATVEMAHRLVYKQKRERLAYAAYYGHALLLPYRHTPHGIMRPGVDTELAQPFLDLLRPDMPCQRVFQLYVLESCQFGKKIQFLGKICQSLTPEFLPPGDRKSVV